MKFIDDKLWFVMPINVYAGAIIRSRARIYQGTSFSLCVRQAAQSATAAYIYLFIKGSAI